MISTHILDISRGCPAAGVSVDLEKFDSGRWITLESKLTDPDGRIVYSKVITAGDYRLHFKIEKYMQDQIGDIFFLNTPISFRISDINRKYHVPLLLSHYGLSTYRGS